MAQSTVAQFSAELGLPTALLLEQLKSACVSKVAAEDKLDEADKTALLDYLRKEHGAEQAPKSKITLVRKQNTEIKKTDSTGRARTIQVEVRKKRTFVKRDESAPEEKVERPVVAVDPAEVARLEAEERKQAELIARQEAELIEKQAYIAKLEAEKESQENV